MKHSNRKLRVGLVVAMLVCLALSLTGCNETQQVKPVAVGADIVPLRQQLIPIQDRHQEWKDTYGEGWESLIAYNLAILRANDKSIGEFIVKAHPLPDPNAVTLEPRVEKLEEKLICFHNFGPSDPNE